MQNKYISANGKGLSRNVRWKENTRHEPLYGRSCYIDQTAIEMNQKLITGELR